MTVTVHHPTDDAAWHALRQQDVTASVAAALLGIHPYQTPYELWAAKAGRLPAGPTTKAMRRGNLLEPVAVQVLAEERPDWTIDYSRDRAYFRDAVARIGATPDVFVVRPGMPGRGIVQIKTTSHEAFVKDWLDPDTGDVVPPLWIAVQTIIEAKLTDATSAAVASWVWNRDALDMHVVDVPIHDAVWHRVVAKVAEFWAMIEAGDEPDPDWGRDGRIILRVYADSEPDRVPLVEVPGLDALAARYAELGAVEADAARERAIIKPQLIYALGNAEAGFTERFEISAPTTRKDAAVVKAHSFRSLRVRPRKEFAHG